jgi:hypothetical protein
LDSSQPELTLPSKSPFDATVVTLDAGDVLADAILQVASDPLDFPLLKKSRSVAWDLDEAVLGGGIAHVDKAQGRAVEGFLNVPAVGNFEALTSRQLPIKPSRAIAANLPLKRAEIFRENRRTAGWSKSAAGREFESGVRCIANPTIAEALFSYRRGSLSGLVT